MGLLTFARILPGRRGLIVSLLLLALSGCADSSGRGARARFPIGIYGADDPKDLKALKESGFDSICTYVADPRRFRDLAREAKRLGMGMVISPQELKKGPLSETRGWPVLAWYLQDEPEVHRISADALESTSRETRRWDTDRLQTFVVGEGSAAQKYGRIADILMLDWYPVPHMKLDSVADQIDLAYEPLPQGKPLWMVLQAMDWRDFPQRDPKKPRIGRFPDHFEIRFMSYLAILHGARGLFYFTFRKPGGKTLLDYPEQWQALARVTREIKSLQPILEKGGLSPLPFPPDPDGVEARTWRYRGRDYCVILNRKGGMMQRVPDELLSGSWRPLFEPRRDPRDLLKKAGRAWYLRPYQVMVFESGLRWRQPARPGPKP